MNQKLLVVLIAATASSAAMAQTNPFHGASIGIGMSSVGASTKISDSNSAIFDLGKQTTVATIEAGYMVGIAKDLGLGITVTYDVDDIDGGSTADLDFRGRDHYSINLKPGYVIGDSTMVYALWGHHRIKGSLTSGISTASHEFRGQGIGFGVQTMFGKHIYLKAEAQKVTYSSYTSGDANFDPSATVGTIGFGYKF